MYENYESVLPLPDLDLNHFDEQKFDDSYLAAMTRYDRILDMPTCVRMRIPSELGTTHFITCVRHLYENRIGFAKQNGTEADTRPQENEIVTESFVKMTIQGETVVSVHRHRLHSFHHQADAYWEWKDEGDQSKRTSFSVIIRQGDRMFWKKVKNGEVAQKSDRLGRDKQLPVEKANQILEFLLQRKPTEWKE